MHKTIVELLKCVEEEGKSSALSKILYDGKWDEAYKKDFLSITTVCERILLSKSIPSKFQNCAGNFSPNSGIIAIIGEKPSKGSTLKRLYPFGSVDGCSGWLNNLIAKNGINEKRLFWINALNLDGTENDPQIIHQLQPKEIICLGKIAEKWADKNGWKYTAFSHPQYWKRFKSKEPYPFIEYLCNRRKL